MSHKVQNIYVNLANHIFAKEKNRNLISGSFDFSYLFNKTLRKIFHRFLILELMAKRGWPKIREYLDCAKRNQGKWNYMQGIFKEINIYFPGSVYDQDEIVDCIVIDDIDVYKLLDGLETQFSLEEIIYFHENLTGIYFEKNVNGDLVFNGEKRKLEGVYYTPANIVNYIVDATLGVFIEECKNKYSEGKKEELKGLKEKFKDLRILDPSCGSGVFLMRITQRLIELYQDFNSKVQKIQLDSLIIKSPAAFIAKYNIQGLDIDPRAVEFTRFNLTTMLADPDWEIIKNVYRHLKESVKTGNFIELSESPGMYNFVIGNPPYVSNREIDLETKRMIKEKFITATGQFDLIIPFVEGALKILKKDGKVGFILPNKYLAADYGSRLRKLILENCIIEQIVDASTVKVFDCASVYPIIQIIRKAKPHQKSKVLLYELTGDIDAVKINATKKATIEQRFYQLAKDMITTELNTKSYQILKKILSHDSRLSCSNILCGIAKSGFSRKIINDETYQTLSESERCDYKRIIQVSNIKQYHIDDYYNYIHKEVAGKKQWATFDGPKLLIAGMAKRLTATIDQNGSALGRIYYLSADRFKYDLYFLLGLLNSRIVQFFYQTFFWPVHLEGGYLRFNSTYLAQIPIPDIAQSCGKNISEQAYKIEKLTTQGLTHSHLMLEIDLMVGKSYGLDLDEIKYIQIKMEGKNGTS